MMISVTGCSLWEQEKGNDLSYLKGQHIAVVIDKFKRNPDVIEDWSDYKRYTWRQCSNTGKSAVGLRNNDAYYLKPEVVCCNIQFDADRKNIVFNYTGLDNCPINNKLNKD